METKDFRKLIKEHFKPKINDLGFKGSDLHFVKHTEEHYIYTLVIQASKYGGSCVMEMGVHFDFLSSQKATVHDCEFRKRLQPELSLIDKLKGRSIEKWHEYGENEAHAVKTINEMWSLFDNQALKYFNQFQSFPNPITEISLEEIESGSKRLYKLGTPSKLRLALLIARVHHFLGNYADAKHYAEWGIKNIGNATGLIESFRKLIQEV